MITVDYSFYTGTFKGKTTQADFDRLAVKASAYLDRVTFDRLTNDLPAATLNRVKLAFCEVVDTLLLNEHGGGIASESNDGVSVNYVAGISNAKTDQQRLREAAALYLAGTGLLYRGVD